MSVYINRDVQCCGLREIDGLSEHKGEPEKALFEVATQMFGPFYSKKVKQVNPYLKPKGVKWQTDKNRFYSERFFVTDSGMIVYEGDAEQWEEDQRYGSDSYDYDENDAKWRYAVFTQAGTRQKYGKQFASLIAKENLGTVVQATTKTVRNPNSGNILKAWLWTVNHKALRTWAQKFVEKEKR